MRVSLSLGICNVFSQFGRINGARLKSCQHLPPKLAIFNQLNAAKMAVMGTYYKCLCGDSEHLALMEPDAVAICDSLGRNWMCYPIPDEEVERLSMLGHLTDVHAADDAARRFGLSNSGTEVRIYCCDDEHELEEKLGLQG